MSVETAREAISDLMQQHLTGWTLDSEGGEDMAVALDRLCDEVRAEMPCYRDMTNKDRCRGAPPGQDNPFAGDEPLCPSCTAQAKLEAR